MPFVTLGIRGLVRYFSMGVVQGCVILSEHTCAGTSSRAKAVRPWLRARQILSEGRIIQGSGTAPDTPALPLQVDQDPHTSCSVTIPVQLTCESIR